MGPKKDPKRAAQKRDQGSTIEEPLNTDSWRCVVVMAVERTHYDSFVLKEFMAEFTNGRRQEVSLIDFNTFLMKILKDFATGELHNKYLSLLNFSLILQEASEDESLLNIQKKAAGPQDPILAMAERPANYAPFDPKKKEPAKKTDNAPKLRPSSLSKQDTKLLKRGEGVKDDQHIQDAPLDGYFNLYVLLTGFYQPDLPLELLKGGVPLHGLLCIDTSLSGLKRESLITHNRLQKRHESDTKSQEIQSFWDAFLKILWDPRASPHFKDTVFQVYVPRKLCCEKNKLREFIYREISYLMYDLSDFKKQLNNYLCHLKLWDVEEKGFERSIAPWGPKNVPHECASAPLVLQCVIDAICGDDDAYGLSSSSESIGSTVDESSSSDKFFTFSAQCRHGSSYRVQQDWSQALVAMSDFDSLTVYHKTKELDGKYDLDHDSIYFHSLERMSVEQNSDETTCELQFRPCGENMEEALAKDGAFRSYWKKYNSREGTPFALDYCLYPLLMTRVFCPYLIDRQTPPITSPQHSLKDFQLIENLSSQMRKPHFTVTNSSRNILRALPYNIKDTSKDFFSPPEFKIVSPEKLKASSAPQFRVSPCLKIHRAFTSQVFSHDIPKNLFDNLAPFLGECFFANVNGFDFLELFGKNQFIEKKKAHWSNYNCVDHTYSIINDCIFIILHNRMGDQNIHHETFNEELRTAVGLRDFYDYVLEDEAEWLASQEQPPQLLTAYKNDSSHGRVLDDFSESDFWLINSIKYQEGSRCGRTDVRSSAITKAKSINAEKAAKSAPPWTPSGPGDMPENSSFDFEGYNVSDMAVQFSGLKTAYYSHDCSMTVELCERLYGNQQLGIHVTADGHTLHLYSYVCPEPHISDPFTFHLTYKNGIIVAFSRRFIETLEEVEEVIESRTAVKGKKNSSELSTRVIKRLVPKLVRDEDFIYDMAASLPNGLSIRIVRRAVDPCYITQQYLPRTDGSPRPENSRLFLPNGSVVKMLSDGNVEILKSDTSTFTASLFDLANKGEPPRPQFDSFHFVSPEGYACACQNGHITPPHRLQTLRNFDLNTNQQFFRRRDGTNYLLQSDGSLCTEFKDGTKLSTSIFVMEDLDALQEDGVLGETDSDLDFLFVHTRTTAEHPDYATVVYDSHLRKWTILLPQDSTITVGPDGQYSLDIDKHTELRAEEALIQMNRYSSGRQLECAATADLSVFQTREGGIYCHMEDLKGKIFIVEANSNCYILDDERVSEESETLEESSGEGQSELSVSEFIASADLQCEPPDQTRKSSALSRRNKYFVLKRDMTGFELLHSDDVRAALSEKDKGSLVFFDSLPGTENRLFVLITPEITKTCRKWQVATVLPDPRYTPTACKRETSSTYGFPPSWMYPFPKQKSKFQVPQSLSCRLFIETKKTLLSPPVGQIDRGFYEMDDVQRPTIPSDGVEQYLTRLSNNDHDLLVEMYAHVAESLINEKKKLKPVHTDKLNHYLNMSKYYVDLQEYHKHCIRYGTVPNYFHHPTGISWLILNHMLDELQIPNSEMRVSRLGPDGVSDKSTAPTKSTTTFSNEEIEYDLYLSEVLTFSELSYRSDLSAQTAPPVLRTAGLCKCKVTSVKDAASAPVVKCYWNDSTRSLLDDPQQSHPRPCDFHEPDLQMLSNTVRQVPTMTLEVLMCLGLV